MSANYTLSARLSFPTLKNFARSVAVMLLGGLALASTETAVLGAGNVSVYTSRGVLMVDGDHAENRIQITRDKSGFVAVNGLDGTRINGVVNGQRLYDAARDIVKVNLRGGEDTCTVEDCLLSELSIRAEWVNIWDTVVWSKVVVDGSMRGRSGAVMLFGNLRVYGDTFVNGTNGADYLILRNCDFNNLFQADLGHGNDQVTLNSEDGSLWFGELQMMLGEGYDSIFVNARHDMGVSPYGDSAIFGGYYWETENTAGIVNLSTNVEDHEIYLGTFYGFDW